MPFIKGKFKNLSISHKNICLWLTIGFLLKSVGAAWDVSYHFKHFREFYQLPHIVNGVGDLIVVFLFIYLWVKGVSKLRPQLRIILYGMIVFVIGVGFDQWSHEKYGIDLTTWSPSHFVLYIGTMISLIGAFLYIYHDYHNTHMSTRVKKVFGVVFSFLILDSFWFPLLQHEQGVIMDYYLKRGISLADPDLLDLFFKTQHNIYSNLPVWLYGAWAVLSAVLVFQFVKRMNFYKYGATAVAAVYLLERVIMNTIFYLIHYPTSAMPFYLILIALAFDIVYNKLEKHSLLRNITTSMIPVIGIILLASFHTDLPIHPPIPVLETFLFAIPAAILGYIFGVLLYRLFFRDFTFSSRPANRA